MRIDAEEKRTSEKLLYKLSHSPFNFTISSELCREDDSMRLCKYLYGEKNQLENFRRNKRENPYFRTNVPRREVNPLALQVAVNIGSE